MNKYKESITQEMNSCLGVHGQIESNIGKSKVDFQNHSSSNVNKMAPVY